MKKNGKTALFKRSLRGTPVGTRTDEPGTVSVRLGYLEGGKYANGTLSKAFTVVDARVSEVYAALVHALFGEENA